jgi:hypothetical protein
LLTSHARAFSGKSLPRPDQAGAPQKMRSTKAARAHFRFNSAGTRLAAPLARRMQYRTADRPIQPRSLRSFAQ